MPQLINSQLQYSPTAGNSLPLSRRNASSQCVKNVKSMCFTASSRNRPFSRCHNTSGPSGPARRSPPDWTDQDPPPSDNHSCRSPRRFPDPIVSRQSGRSRCTSIAVPVRAVKMAPVPGEIGILSFSSRKCELRPGLDRTGIRNSLIPVIPGVLHRQHFLPARPRPAGGSARYRPSLRFQPDAALRQLQDTRACSIFRRDSALLIKFSQIVCIIHAVADVAFSACAFIGRRQPDAADSQRGPAPPSRRTASNAADPRANTTRRPAATFYFPSQPPSFCDSIRLLYHKSI